jgi:hypothetical protein
VTPAGIVSALVSAVPSPERALASERPAPLGLEPSAVDAEEAPKPPPSEGPLSPVSLIAAALGRFREASGTSASAEAEAPAPEPHSPFEVARAVLDELAAHSGEAIVEAQAQGRLFSEFGAVIAEAYEFYRRRVGPGADPAPFRAALRELWNVDLDPTPGLSDSGGA